MATFSQIFQSSQRRSSRHYKETHSELPCVGCAREENPTYTAPLCSCFWQAALRGTLSSECTRASTHQGKACLLFCHNWHISQLGRFHLENEAPSGGLGVSVPWEISKNTSPNYLQQLPEKMELRHEYTCMCWTHSKWEQDHEEGGQQNSRWWHIGQLQQPDLSQEGSIPPLATSLPTMLLSKIML